MIIFLVLLPYQHIENWPKSLRSYTFAIVIGLFLAKLLASVIFLVDDLRRVLQWAGGKLFYSAAGEEYKGITISRSVFMSWLGIGLGSVLFGSLVWGFRTSTGTKVQNLELAYDNLPHAFKGLKVVQISDIHSGSFMDKESGAAWRKYDHATKAGSHSIYRRPGE
jgi:hypothetical protein